MLLCRENRQFSAPQIVERPDQMRNKVRLKKGQLAYFRKLARESKNEIQAFLIGEIVNKNLIVIDEFAYPPQYAMQTPEKVQWYTADFEKVRQRAEERGKCIVGFIHSHPNWDAVLSPPDYDICIKDMHALCGIVSTHGRHTSVRFWVMDSALDCEIVYEKKKGTPTKFQEDSD